MRSTLRLLASAKPSTLTPYAPTGLTGLETHPSPRATLHTIYDKTLSRLRELPETSIYRQSCESITLRRLQAVLNAKPAGYDEWQKRIESIISSMPEDLITIGRRSDKSFEIPPKRPEPERNEKAKPWPEGGLETPAQARAKLEAIVGEEVESRLAEKYGSVEEMEGWGPEPPLSTEQISELEEKIGAGLIEEVVQVAEGELKLVDEMARSKAWEPLVEKPAEGQWKYFERQGPVESSASRK